MRWYYAAMIALALVPAVMISSLPFRDGSGKRASQKGRLWIYAMGVVCAEFCLLSARALDGLIVGGEGLFSPYYLLFYVPVTAMAMSLVYRMARRDIAGVFAGGVDVSGWQIMWLPQMAFFLLMLISDVRDPARERLTVAAVTGFGAYITYLMCARMAGKLMEAARRKERDAQLERIIAQQSAQYVMLTEQIDAMRKARHDLRHHMSALWQYVESGDRQSLGEYLSEYGKDINMDSVSVCANRAVDSVAQHYLGAARAEGIEVDAAIDVAEDMGGISTPDICIALGNTLENAVEAVRREPEGVRRFIRVRTENTPSWLTIVVGNSFTGKLRAEGDGYLSSKEPGRVGVGLASIRSIAEKYGGMARYRTVDGVFLTEMILFKSQ